MFRRTRNLATDSSSRGGAGHWPLARVEKMNKNSPVRNQNSKLYTKCHKECNTAMHPGCGIPKLEISDSTEPEGDTPRAPLSGVSKVVLLGH